MSIKLSITKKKLAFIKLMRPYKWSKNIIVFAALLFSQNLFNPELLIKVTLSFFIFSLYSSFIYIINDIYDAERDAQHPDRKKRPIASGLISKDEALKFAIFILIITTIPASFLLNVQTLSIFAAYILMNFAYSIRLKREFLIDIFIIATGFVFRVLVGAFAINTIASPWLILSSFVLALFLALSKRYHEAVLLNGDSKTRESLEHYTKENTNQMMIISSTLVIMTYILYTFNSDFKNIVLTIPFVIYGNLRYLYLMSRKDIGSEPELVFFKDRPFLFNIILWVISVLILVYIYP